MNEEVYEAIECEEEEFDRCDVCGVRDDSVRYTIDPYAQEMTGTEHWMFMCAVCYTNAVMDI